MSKTNKKSRYGKIINTDSNVRQFHDIRLESNNKRKNYIFLLTSTICLFMSITVLLTSCDKEGDNTLSITDSSVPSTVSVNSSETSKEIVTPSQTITMTPQSKINSSKSSISESASVDSKIPDVKIPANFNPSLPSDFHVVPTAQKPGLMQNLTLFTNPSDCKLIIYADSSIVNIIETSEEISMKPIASTANESVQKAGVLIALSTNKNYQKVEMLHINLDKNGSDWLISTVKNDAMGTIPLKSQLRIISPRFTLTKEQTNDTSKLKTFDPTPFGASDKAPFRMRPECWTPMMNMLNKAKSEGMTSINIRDTYRGYTLQNTYFQNKVNYYRQNGLTLAQAKIKTEQLIAAPGTSEHHGGYTADITVKNTDLDQDFSKTTFGIWLSKNCWNYGYIIRYLSGKEEQTTKVYEPWHIRYVGIPASLILRKYGIVLDEFHAYLKDRQFIASSYDANPESSDSTEADGIFARFNAISDCKIPSDIAKSASTVFSDVGDGSYVMFCEF